MRGLAVLAAGLGLAAAAAMPPGPDPAAKITAAYAKLVGRDVYFWAYPMLATYGRRIVASRTHETVMAGALPQAPLNHLGMLTNYIDPAEQTISSPDQDVILGMGTLALDVSPVVVQVPFMGDRYWVYQLLDARGDSFAQLGSMYPDSLGTFLLVGPDWKGETPKGVKKVFRSSSNTGTVIVRIYQNGTPEENRWLQGGLEYMAMYPLADYDGTMKAVKWRKLPAAEPAPGRDAMKGIDPETAFDILADVLDDAPPLPGEQARYAQVLAVLEAAQQDPKLKQAMIEGAKATDDEVVSPLFEYRNAGRELTYHWRTVDNGSAFGTDYFARTAAAKSNTFLPRPSEVKLFDLDTDGKGNRLDGLNLYTIAFPNGALPPGFAWSLSAYNEHHLFESNGIKRYMLGTRSAPMKPAGDGSLTIYLQAEAPAPERRENWLPVPRGNFSLVLRVYAPKAAVLDGSWTPPAVVRVP